MDKYNLMSLAPSLAIVASMIVMAAVGISLLRKAMAKDAAKAGE